MYQPRRLIAIAWSGLRDLITVMRAEREQPSSDVLQRVYGPHPMWTLTGLAVAACLGGWWFDRYGLDFPFKEHVHWPAVALALILAVFLRRFLFGSPTATDSTRPARPEDFNPLASSMAPPVLICIAITLLSRITAFMTEDAISWAADAGVLALLVVEEIGVAAALTIAVATLCYSRDWVQALLDLAVRLAVFKIMIWVTALVMLDVGVVGMLAGIALSTAFGWQMPQWLSELANQLSYAGLMAVAYLAVIGGVWTVCRGSFAELLTSGHVNVVRAVEALAKDELTADVKVGDRA